MIAFDPAEKYRYVISTDRNKPVEEQPVLLFHYPTCREQRKVASLFDEAFDTRKIVLDPKATDVAKRGAADKELSLRCEALQVLLCGWTNIKDRSGQPIPYDASKLDEILSACDFDELEARLIQELRNFELEKKVSAFTAQSKQASSAPSATAASA